VISYAVNGKQYVAAVSGMTAGFWRTARFVDGDRFALP
jgi:hypothetical protein